MVFRTLIVAGICRLEYLLDSFPEVFTFLNPISHPCNALPVFPPKARHKI